jgi:hypothetical protein
VTPAPQKKTEEKKTEAPKAEAAPASPSAKTQASAAAVSVAGIVTLEGKPPAQQDIDMSGVKECAAQHPDPVPEQSFVVDDKGHLQNVVVYVSGSLPNNPPPPTEPAVLDQHGCMYSPHVLPVMVGQPIMIRNSDSFLHNVHSLSQTNPSFNFAQPNADAGKAVEPLKASETFRVKCDVHPWMSAYIVAVDNPYFAVSGEDGKFSLAGLPDGEYTLVAWQEQLGTKEIPVKVEAGKAADVKITFTAP